MQLIDGLQQGDIKAFDAIYERFHHRLYFFIRKKTQSDFLAEEVVQLTFIKLWERRANLHKEVALEVQLFGMARQVMIDQLRKEAARNRYEGDSAATPFTDNFIQMIEAKDLIRIFDEQLENMPPARKLIFTLSREQGMSHKEIADMMGISTKTVENHIAKALSQLKQYLYSIML